MALLTFPKGSRDKLSPHFIAREFDCSCSSPQCTTTEIDQTLVDLLETMRSFIKAPLRISSGYRCKHKQAELRLAGYETSVGQSTHELGRAADVTGASTGLTGKTLEQAARKAGFRAVGVGNLFVHVDLRDDKDRRWTYGRG